MRFFNIRSHLHRECIFSSGIPGSGRGVLPGKFGASLRAANHGSCNLSEEKLRHRYSDTAAQATS